MITKALQRIAPRLRSTFTGNCDCVRVLVGNAYVCAGSAGRAAPATRRAGGPTNGADTAHYLSVLSQRPTVPHVPLLTTKTLGNLTCSDTMLCE